KAAAAAGFWHSGAEPELVVFGWPSARAQANLAAVSLAGAGGRWLHRDASLGYLGLDKFSGMQPPVAFTFWSLRLALGLGLLMLAASCATLALTCRRGFDPAALPRWWLRVLSLLMFAGALGVVATWCYDLAGMQPYAVNRAVTQSEVLGPVTTPALLYSLAGHIALYAVLLAAFVGMLFHAARYGVVPVRKTGGSS
ncbi:cytochrome ubiquinol oxidase subunit I, partial [Bordetella bronchiseptica]